MTLGRKLGEGGTSEVFEWEGSTNKIIKLAKPNATLSDLQRELKNNQIVWESGISVPEAFEIVQVNNRPGIIFERVYGETIKERLFTQLAKKIDKGEPILDLVDVRNIARLLSKLHQLTHPEMPQQREYLTRQILRVNYLSEIEKQSVIDHLAHLPVNNKICHGDPNPNNVILKDGELVLIDWNDASIGSPEADIAEFIVMIKFAVLPPNTPKQIVHNFDSNREIIIRVFMDEYTVHTGMNCNDMEPWIVPIAARKLSADAISEKEKQLLVNEIRKRL